MSVYDEVMVPRLFDPWARLLLDDVNTEGGMAALDVACGPGTVTRQIARRVGPTGRVTGCDLSPAMLELARAKHPADTSAPIIYRECPADALAVAESDFDLVTCQQGIQFFPNRPAALAEMRRAVRPGGQLGVAVWCDVEASPPFAALADALGQVLGPQYADTYKSGPWGFGSAESLVRLVTDAGFDDVSLRTCALPVTFEGGPHQLMLTLHAAAVAPTVANLSDADLAELTRAVGEAARPITFDGVVSSHATSYVVTARVGDT